MAAGLILSSCATILNRKTQQISIDTSDNITVTAIDSSPAFFREGHSIQAGVMRCKEPLKVNIRTGATQQVYVYQPHSSLAYWANIYFNYGLGMLVDKDNPKRYAYPKHIYIGVDRRDVIASHFIPSKKGSVNWHVAMPYINNILLKTPERYSAFNGFFGLETGIDYYYRYGKFFSLYAGAASSFPVPFPVPLDRFGEYQTASAGFVSLRNNYAWRRFGVGYGVHYSRLRWQEYNIDSVVTSQTKNNSLLGLSLHSSYRLGNSFQLGLLYQPCLINFDKRSAVDYQHLFSVELIWKIHIHNGNE